MDTLTLTQYGGSQKSRVKAEHDLDPGTLLGKFRNPEMHRETDNPEAPGLAEDPGK